MTTENIALFKAMAAKMGYLDQRQKVIAQNVANADTPGYVPHDLTQVDFGVVLRKVTSGGQDLMPVSTQPNHMPSAGDLDNPDNIKQKVVYEIAPVGNAVVLEEQMINSAKTSSDYNLMTSLYQKNVAMIRMSLGRSQ